MVAAKKTSLLWRLMSASAAKTGAAAMRFLHRQEDDAGFVFRDEDDDDDTDDDDINLLFQQQQPITAAHEEIVVVHNEVAVITAAAKPKLTRIKYPRRNQKHSPWWSEYLMPESRQELLLHQADGRLAKRFRRHFHVPFEVFVDLTALAKERWRLQ